MTKGSFPERSAHLSYVAPLIAGLLLAQLGEAAGPAGLTLVAILLAGGLFSAFTGARWSKRARGTSSRAALLGFALNAAFILGLLSHVARA